MTRPSEYDVRRPLTATGTNLLGLVKHVATVEARYFGEVFDRPSPEPLSRWQDYDGSDLWATEEETRDQNPAVLDELGARGEVDWRTSAVADAASLRAKKGRSLTGPNPVIAA